jgi:murein DD-endopeptidase MepM/ murein hydrolase activator NlpD
MDNKYNINKIDFGFEPSNNRQKPKKFNSDPSISKIKYIQKSLVRFFNKTRSVFFVTKTRTSRFKWHLSRSIFLGRGVYFKYISNLSILFMILVTIFIYSVNQYKKNPSSALVKSKYLNTSLSTDEVLYTAETDSVLQTKQFNIIKHSVQPNETLSSIAGKYSSPDNTITVEDIRLANNLKNDFLSVGSVLEIPPVHGIVYTVGKADDPIAILKKYKKLTNTSSEQDVEAALQELADVNVLDINIDGEKRLPRLIEGQKIVIPGGVLEVIQAPVAVKPQTPTVRQLPQPLIPASQGGRLFVWPVSGSSWRVTQGYKGSAHPAIDIGDRSRPYVVAVADGVISYQGWENGGGGCVVHMKFDNGYGAEYAHLTCGTYLFKPGDRVRQGQALGRMGDSGKAFGVHLHFMLFPNGKSNPSGIGSVNPLTKLPAS